MSKRLKNNSELVKYILTLTGKNSQLKKLLLSLTNEELKVIGEIAGNLLYGTIPLSDLHKKSLKPFKSILVVISSPKTGLKKRRSILLSKPNLVSKVFEASRGFLKSVI